MSDTLKSPISVKNVFALGLNSFVLISSSFGVAIATVFLMIHYRLHGHQPRVDVVLLAAIFLYLLSVVTSSVFKLAKWGGVLLLLTVHLLFLAGLLLKDFHFFTLILSPLIPAFPPLILGFKHGVRWFLIFIPIMILVAFLPVLSPFFAFSVYDGYLVFNISVVVAIINFACFSIPNQKFIESTQELIQSQVDEITRLGWVDPLTNIFNRRAFLERLTREMARCERTVWRLENTELQKNKNEVPAVLGHFSKPQEGQIGCLTVLLFDVDYFKKVNDKYGHLAGDAVLKAFGMELQSKKILREADCAARYGGEEFIVFCPDTHLVGGAIVANKIRKRVETLSFSAKDGSLFSVTVSCGVAEYRVGDKKVEDIIARADTALYEAKDKGRNQVVCFNG